MMLQSSRHLPPASKGLPHAAGTLHMRCGRTGERVGLAHRQIATAEKHCPACSSGCNQGQGRRMPPKMARKGCLFGLLSGDSFLWTPWERDDGAGISRSLRSGDTGCWALSGRERRAGGLPSALMEKIPNQETKEPHRALRGTSQPAQLIPQTQWPLGKLCRENKTVLDSGRTGSGGAHIFLHAQGLGEQKSV